MSAEAGVVRPLDPKSAALVSACARVGSMVEAIGELVMNSLDAQATKVDVLAFPHAFRFTVADNGRGVCSDSLSLLGEKGATSKEIEAGLRGGFLAALSEIASVEIHTRVDSNRAVFRKWMRYGETLFMGEDLDDPSLDGSGSIVDVWEMFHNLPVRRNELMASEEVVDREMNSIVQIVQKYAILNPMVEFSANDGGRLYFRDSAKRKEDWMERLIAVLGHRANRDLHFLSAKSDDYSVEGFASIEPIVPFGLDESQFVSLNGYLVDENSRTNIKAITLRAWKQAFVRTGKRHEYPNRRAPVFILQIRCPSSFFSVQYRGGYGTFSVLDEGKLKRAMVSTFEPFLSGVEDIKVVKPSPTEAQPNELSGFGFWVRKRGFSEQRTNVSQKTENNSIFEDRLLRTLRPQSVENVTAHSRRPFKSSPGPELVRRLEGANPDWENPCQPSAGVPMFGSLSNHRRRTKEHTFRYHREMLSRMRLIGSIEDQLIVVRLPGSIHVIDQHAADERSRLEAMLTKIANGDISAVVTHVPCPNDTVVTVSSTEAEVYKRSKSLVESWGWTLREKEKVTETSGASYDLLSVPCIGSLVVEDIKVLHEFLRDVKEIGDAQARLGTVPSIFHQLCTAACRSAIMFGDKLSTAERDRLLDRLHSCALPFQCAHGRPSIIPLVIFDLPHAAHTPISKERPSKIRSIKRLRSMAAERPKQDRPHFQREKL